MLQFRETTQCTSCQTSVTVATMRKDAESVDATTRRRAALCPICNSPLPLRILNNLDSAAIEILAFGYADTSIQKSVH
jgi:hypothetical protein